MLYIKRMDKQDQTKVIFRASKKLMEAFDSKLKEDGLNRSEVLRRWILEYNRGDRKA